MTFIKSKYIHRSFTELEIKNFLFESKRTAALCFLRGRRRIGKSTLLYQLQSLYKIPVFVFTGGKDEKEVTLKKRLITEWSLFNPKSNLSKMKINSILWRDIFVEFGQHANELKSPLCICIDEIQWVAKGQTGFIGQFKEAWLTLEKIKNLKIILSGSSNKFFHKYTGGEEQILRGMCTHNDIWLTDISPSVLKKEFVPHWKNEEVIFAYMCLGGVPYYWQQFDEKVNFIQTFNKACFTSSSFVLKEALEILRLEFNKAGTTTAINLLKGVGFLGKTLEQLEKVSRLPHSSASILVEKLLDYGIIKTFNDPNEKFKTTSRGQRYYIQDPFLNFYFQIIWNIKSKISRNQTNELIFASLLGSKNGFYINEFSGYAFENLVRRQLLVSVDRSEKIFKTLGLINCEFEVGTIKQSDRQIDIVIFNSTDKTDRWIECRWSQSVKEISDLIDEVLLKKNETEDLEIFIATNVVPTKTLLQKAEVNEIKLIGINDLM